MSKQCEIVQDLLPLYVDGVCSEASAELVKGHVEACEACRTVYEKLTETQYEDSLQSEEKAVMARYKRKVFGLIAWILGIALSVICAVISLPILLAAIMSVMSVFLWEGYHSLFFVVGLALNTLAMGYFNPQNLRKSILLTSSLILIYNLFIPSIGGTINEVVAITSSIVGLIRYRKKAAV